MHFQSRQYDDGETARFCTLDLAPEAPWRCPPDCHRYERLAIATDFVEGSLARTDVETEPDASPEDVAAVLDDAEDIVTPPCPACSPSSTSSRCLGGGASAGEGPRAMTTAV